MPLQTQIFICLRRIRVGGMPRKLSVFLTRLLKTKGDDAGEVRVITKSAMGKEGNSNPHPKEPRKVEGRPMTEEEALDRVTWVNRLAALGA